MNKLTTTLLIVCSVVFAGCGRTAVSPARQFSLRLADSQPQSGMASAVMQSSGDTVFLDKTDIVIGPDFERIWITTDAKGRPAIFFSVNEAAAKKLSSTTSANAGKMIALVVDGVPQTAIPISGPFSDSFQVTGDFTDAEITQFYRAVTGYNQL